MANQNRASGQTDSRMHDMAHDDVRRVVHNLMTSNSAVCRMGGGRRPVVCMFVCMYDMYVASQGSQRYVLESINEPPGMDQQQS